MKATEEQNKLLYSKLVFRRYALGNYETYEFGLQHEEENVKIEIKEAGIMIIIDDRCYNSRMYYNFLMDKPFVFQHKPRGWLTKLGYKVPEGKYDTEGYYTLEVNNTEYS